MGYRIRQGRRSLGGDCPMTSGVPSNAAMPVPVVPTQRHSFFDDLLGLIDSG